MSAINNNNIDDHARGLSPCRMSSQCIRGGGGGGGARILGLDTGSCVLLTPARGSTIITMPLFTRVIVCYFKLAFIMSTKVFVLILQ